VVSTFNGEKRYSDFGQSFPYFHAQTAALTADIGEQYCG